MYKIKKSLRNFRCVLLSLISIIVQNFYNLGKYKSAKKLVVFLVPPRHKIGGGIMSIFSLCHYTRLVIDDGACLIATYPGFFTYFKNNNFYNNEYVYRFRQIINLIKNTEDVIIHIPEDYSCKFYMDLSPIERKVLKNVKNLHINILNQNICLMPSKEEIKNLFNLTQNITQTTAHKRYANQEICDKWNIPTHLFSVKLNLDPYKSYNFENKEKLIVLSDNNNEHRELISKKIKATLPDWELTIVNNITFDKYMDLIAKAYYTISFGEGMDGYFVLPYYVGSVGIAVYNDLYFPDKTWKNLPFIYSSYDDMSERICSDILKFANNKTLYYNTIGNNRGYLDTVYNYDEFVNNLKCFYQEKYHFYPKSNEGSC